jgi:hypothetical protein
MGHMTIANDMPRLPSGRHVAVDSSPLQELVDGAYQGKFVHVLMAITEIEHLFPHVNVLYFRPKSGKEGETPVSTHSNALPEDLEPFPSGYNLTTIHAECELWPGEDQVAFSEFLNDSKRRVFFEEILAAIRDHQERLLAQPTTVPGLMAHWWKQGCHPLQEEAARDHSN